MPHPEPKRWQFSLQAIFAALTLLSIMIWVVQTHLLALLMALFVLPGFAVAIALEFLGYSELAVFVGAALGTLWFLVVIW